jgi:hypothetical protein
VDFDVLRFAAVPFAPAGRAAAGDADAVGNAPDISSMASDSTAAFMPTQDNVSARLRVDSRIGACRG